MDYYDHPDTVHQRFRGNMMGRSERMLRIAERIGYKEVR
jgi:hypothetical protein